MIAGKNMSKSLSIAIDEKWHQSKNSSVQALGQFRLEIEAGELFVLVGESGCGKTTLIRMILGLDLDYTGSIAIAGQPVAGPGTDRGVVFQDTRLLPWMTVVDNVEFALPTDLSQSEKRKRSAEVLALVGLLNHGANLPRELSGGMAQRAALARALVNVPEILILDEPFGALDLHTRIRMQEELLAVLNQTGTTTLLVTHDLDEALYLADRIGIMSSHPGKLIAIHDVQAGRPRDRADEALMHLRVGLFDELLSARG